MGNTLITVHNKDGSVKYYTPPVCVMDILIEHPDYVVVSVSKGKTNILSSELDLLPGGKYYILSPDSLLSTTGDSQIPSDYACSCRKQKFAHLPQIVALYFISATSLFGVLIPCARPKKANLSGVTQKPVDFRADQPSGLKTTLSINNDDTEVKSSAATSLSLTSKQKTLQDFMVPEVQTPRSDKASCCSPLFNLCHRKDAKVEPRRVTPDRLSKEKWLEDMIRGADTQYRRNYKLEQAFLIEDAMCECPDQVQAKSWTPCLPSCSRSPSITSSGKKDEDDLDTVPPFEDRQALPPQPPQRSQESADHVVEVNHDQQLQQKDHRRDPQDLQGDSAGRPAAIKELQLEIEQTAQQQLILQREDRHGASARRAAIKVLQLEIERSEELELNESGSKNKQLLREKLDAMERLSLRKQSPSPPSGTAQNFLQKYVRSKGR